MGPIATAALKQLHLDLLFLGVHGMDPEAGFTTPNLLEAETDRAFVAASRKVVVVADHTKWGTQGMSTIAGLEEADEVISDPGLGAEARRILQERVGRLRLVSSGQPGHAPPGASRAQPAGPEGDSRAAAGLADLEVGGEHRCSGVLPRPVPTRALTAASAMAFAGCSTVVSGGQLYSASAEPSKDANAISFGTDRPASCSARRIPTACRSDVAKIAVGRSAPASRRLPAA